MGLPCGQYVDDVGHTVHAKSSDVARQVSDRPGPPRHLFHEPTNPRVQETVGLGSSGGLDLCGTNLLMRQRYVLLSKINARDSHLFFNTPPYPHPSLHYSETRPRASW